MRGGTWALLATVAIVAGFFLWSRRASAAAMTAKVLGAQASAQAINGPARKGFAVDMFGRVLPGMETETDKAWAAKMKADREKADVAMVKQAAQREADRKAAEKKAGSNIAKDAFDWLAHDDVGQVVTTSLGFIPGVGGVITGAVAVGDKLTG